MPSISSAAGAEPSFRPPTADHHVAADGLRRMLSSVKFRRAVLVACLLAASVHAAPRDPVAAEELFLAGRAAMESGDLAAACKRFEESQRLDPAAGTLINWAECLSRKGSLVASMLKWSEAFDTLPPFDERRAAAEERIAALRLRVPRLDVRLAPSSPPGAMIARDGVPIDAAALGLGIPVDPGVHRITVAAPGRTTSEVVVNLAEGERRSISVSAGQVVPAKASVAAVPPAPESDATPVGAWIVGGIGAASVLTGATFGVLAIVEKGRMEDQCENVSGTKQCSEAGVESAHSGDTYATVANVLVPIGIVGLGVGAYWLWSNSSAEERASLRAAPLGTHGAALNFASTF
jgi:hypothetical protein